MTDAHLSPAAPVELEFVRSFVNTLDIEAGTDWFRDADSWRVWAAERGITGQATQGQLEWAVALREELRFGLLANHDREPLPKSTASALGEAARWSQVTVAFTNDGVALSSQSTGITGVIGDVVRASAAALADGTWSRLKACVNDECHWAFYDHSRSRTGLWCSMEVCGNRAKQTRWRTRQVTTSPGVQ